MVMLLGFTCCCSSRVWFAPFDSYAQCQFFVLFA